MERWVSLGGKEGRTKIQISAEPGSNWRACGRKAEMLLNVPTMPAQGKELHINRFHVFKPYIFCKAVLPSIQNFGSLSNHRSKTAARIVIRRGKERKFTHRK